jgi:DNA-binding XRE family transcriptional regulator
MHLSHCSMNCALGHLKKIETESPLITDALEHLALAIFYAEAYGQSLSSIYWNTAKAVTKKQIKQTLNHLAFDAYSALLEASDCLNEYAQEMQRKETPPLWWNEMIISLTLAHDAMVREHGQEISSKQLVLFD